MRPSGCLCEISLQAYATSKGDTLPMSEQTVISLCRGQAVQALPTEAAPSDGWGVSNGWGISTVAWAAASEGWAQLAGDAAVCDG